MTADHLAVIVRRMTTQSWIVTRARCCMARVTTVGLTRQSRWSSAPMEKSVSLRWFSEISVCSSPFIAVQSVGP